MINMFLMKFLGRVSPSMSLAAVPPCINSTAQMNWLNRGDVRKALHIPDILPPWDICRSDVTDHYATSLKSFLWAFA